MSALSRIIFCSILIALAALFFITSQHPEYLYRPDAAFWIQEGSIFSVRYTTLAIIASLISFGASFDILGGNFESKLASDGSRVIHPQYTVFSLCMGAFLYLVSQDILSFFSLEYVGLKLWPFIFVTSAGLSMVISFNARFYYRTETH